MEDKPWESSSSKPNTANEECNTTHEDEEPYEEPILTGMLDKTFKELEAEAPTIMNAEVQEYLATFHESVRNTLRETNTPTGAIPFRGAITLNNLTELFNIMPDLYDYLKKCYSAFESSGDAIINEILDAADACDYNIINKIGEDRCSIFVDNYIAYSYYNDYLPGYIPIAFSIDDRYPPQQEFVPMPRKLYWWQEMEILTWDEYQLQYPESE